MDKAGHTVKILHVDNVRFSRQTLVAITEKLSYQSLQASTGAQALKHLSTQQVDVALLSVALPDIDSLELLQKIISQFRIPVIMIAGRSDVLNAVDAIRHGARDYLIRPHEDHLLDRLLRDALNGTKSKLAVDDKRVIEARVMLVESMGIGTSIHRLIRQAECVAPTELTVLLEGETGTGKGLLAHAIHSMSSRRDGPFITLDCGAIAENVIESELFGHQRGAFTGADQTTPGLFHLADGGTLFIDEINSLPLKIQSKLLGIIEDRIYRPVGSAKTERLNARIIAASNVHLWKMVQQETFRRDLYYRLAECQLQIPPLRKRKEDIPDLARHFITQERGNSWNGMESHLTEETIALLRRHDWMGNVRELRNLIRQIFLVNHQEDGVLRYAHVKELLDYRIQNDDETPLPAKYAQDEASQDGNAPRHPLYYDAVAGILDGSVQFKEVVKSARNNLEQYIFDQVLIKTRGNKASAARLLGLDYKTFHSKLENNGGRARLRDSVT